jgi:hypothetical protein
VDADRDAVPGLVVACSATRSQQGKIADGGRWTSLETGGIRTVRCLAAMSAPLPPADAQPEAVTGPAANSSPTDLPPDSDAILRVRRLQGDLRVLIRHFACWAEASILSVPTANAQALPPGSAAPRIALEPHAALLVIAPEIIARDGRLLGQLYESLEVLTDLAAPANVKSIRLTRAIVGDEDEDLPSDTRSQAQWLLRWARGIAVFGILVFLATILLLVHVDRGRRAVQQLEQIRTEYQAVANSLGMARAASSAASGGADYDCPQPTAPPAAPGPGAPAEQASRGGQGHLLCAQMSDALGRMKIIRQELRNWNVISGRLAYVSPITWLAPQELDRTTGLSEEEWASTELRTLIILAALTGFIMPILLGLLGAWVYTFREINRQIQTSTLKTWESIHGTLRMVLGATLGGLLGVLWTNDQPVRLEGMSLPLGALAFFVGFSVEIVFRLVDTLVRTVADKISKPS